MEDGGQAGGGRGGGPLTRAQLRHSVLEEGGSEKVTFLKQLLHFFGPSDGGEW